MAAAAVKEGIGMQHYYAIAERGRKGGWFLTFHSLSTPSRSSQKPTMSNRLLAGILAADVVGYLAMVGRD
jgi:hypothetical protein